MHFLAVLGWILWAYLIVATLLRLAAYLEARREKGKLWAASEAVASGPVKAWVDLALGAILVGSSLSQRPTNDSARSAWDVVAVQRVQQSTEDGGRPPTVLDLQRDKLTASPSVSHPARLPDRAQDETHGQEDDKGHPRYLVRPGDSLWSIAERRLGDPLRWRDVFSLNRGRKMPDGERLVNPGFIRPGWVLLIPENGRGKPSCAPEGESHKVESERGERASTRGSREPSKPGPESRKREGSVAPSSRRQGERVELPSGTGVAVGFVAGLASAVALSELRRRRIRKPQSPVPGWPRADAHLDLSTRLLSAVRDEPEEGDLDSPGDRFNGVGSHKVDDPTEVVLGHRDGEPVTAPPQALPYCFSGERERVREVLFDTVVHAVVSHRQGFEAWVTKALGPAGAPGLRIFEDEGALLSALEKELLKRRRMLVQEDLADWDTHLKEWPDDPLPLIAAVLIEDADEVVRRGRATAAQGKELGLVVLCFGCEDDSVEVDNETMQPGGALLGLLGEQVSPVHLTPGDRDEALAALRATEPSPEPGEARSVGVDEAIGAKPQQRATDEHVTADSQLRAQEKPSSDEVTSATTETHSPDETGRKRRQVIKVSPGVAHEEREVPAEPRRQAPIEVRLFGPMTIVVDGEEAPAGLGVRTRELLAYLLLHPEGVTREQAVEALWPKANPDAGFERFWKYLQRLRKHLRIQDDDTTKLIDKAGQVYRAERAAFAVDVWEFNRLIAASSEGEAVADSLGAAADLYRGDLLEGDDCPWADAMRAQFRNTFLDTLSRLSKLEEKEGRENQAVEPLRRALEVEPYAEELRKQLMKLYAKLGRPSLVRQQYEQMVEILESELDVEPDQETVDLYHELMKRARRQADE